MHGVSPLNIKLKLITICLHAGILNMYGVFQLTLLVTFHALGLFWSIVFPFHYRRFKLGTKIKYIHITSVILAVVVPIILPLLHLIDGYTIGPNPIIESCSGRNASLNYFLLILPVSILLAFTSSLFVIVFWTILKVYTV